MKKVLGVARTHPAYTYSSALRRTRMDTDGGHRFVKFASNRLVSTSYMVLKSCFFYAAENWMSVSPSEGNNAIILSISLDAIAIQTTDPRMIKAVNVHVNVDSTGAVSPSGSKLRCKNKNPLARSNGCHGHRPPNSSDALRTSQVLYLVRDIVGGDGSKPVIVRTRRSENE